MMLCRRRSLTTTKTTNDVRNSAKTHMYCQGLGRSRYRNASSNSVSSVMVQGDSRILSQHMCVSVRAAHIAQRLTWPLWRVTALTKAQIRHQVAHAHAWHTLRISACGPTVTYTHSTTRFARPHGARCSQVQEKRRPLRVKALQAQMPSANEQEER